MPCGTLSTSSERHLMSWSSTQVRLYHIRTAQYGYGTATCAAPAQALHS